jgi:hypothetical protein
MHLRLSRGGTQFAELGQGRPGATGLQPFNGQLGDISAAQNEASRENFFEPRPTTTPAVEAICSKSALVDRATADGSYS